MYVLLLDDIISSTKTYIPDQNVQTNPIESDRHLTRNNGVNVCNAIQIRGDVINP